MKTVLLLLLVFLVNTSLAETFVPYTPDSLKKGDWIEIEFVHYYSYVAPGIKEEVPWRAENIQRVTFRATVTDINVHTLTIDYTFKNLYDCRNDTKKQGFYYFDSRYQQDFAIKDSAPDGPILHVTYDRKSRKPLAFDKESSFYSYSKTYIPFGVRPEKSSGYPETPMRDSLSLNELLTPLTKDFLTGWKTDGTILTAPDTRIVNASFALPPNTEFTCSNYGINASKDSTIHKKIFISYPTEYKVGERITLLLTPGFRTFFLSHFWLHLVDVHNDVMRILTA